MSNILIDGLTLGMNMIIQGEADETTITFDHKEHGEFEIIIRRPKKTTKKRKI